MADIFRFSGLDVVAVAHGINVDCLRACQSLHNCCGSVLGNYCEYDYFSFFKVRMT